MVNKKEQKIEALAIKRWLRIDLIKQYYISYQEQAIILMFKRDLNTSRCCAISTLSIIFRSLDCSRPSTPSVKNGTQAEKSNAVAKHEPTFSPVRRQLSTRADPVARSGRSSPCSETNGAEPFQDLIQRIYSRDEDEDTRDTPLMDGKRMALDD